LRLQVVVVVGVFFLFALELQWNKEKIRKFCREISTNFGTNLPGFRLGFVHPLLEPVNFILSFVQRLLRLLLLQLKFAQSALTAFQFLANLLHIRHGFVPLGVQTGHAGLTPLVFVLRTQNSNE
jgi:hypothetical protein